jgi:hypothetical protein
MTPALAAQNWDAAALVRLDAHGALARAAERVVHGFRTSRSGAYDGQFYWAIAVDPLATGAVGRAVDKPSYRYGHPLYGWLAWLLSGGRARYAAGALAAIGIAAMAAAAVLASHIARMHGRTGWEGLLVALSPGLLVAANHDLAEPLAAALMLAAVAAYLARRRVAAWILLALLPLAKEPLLVVLAAVVACELLARRRRSAGLYATAAAPSLLWWSYARIHLGAWFVSGGSALAWPLTGWADSLLEPRAAASIPLQLLVLGLVVWGLVEAVRRRDAVAVAFVGLGCVVLCLASNATVAVTTAARNSAFALSLLPAVIGAARAHRPLTRRLKHRPS